jgi:hypothetical protein
MVKIIDNRQRRWRIGRIGTAQSEVYYRYQASTGQTIYASGDDSNNALLSGSGSKKRPAAENSVSCQPLVPGRGVSVLSDVANSTTKRMKRGAKEGPSKKAIAIYKHPADHWMEQRATQSHLAANRCLQCPSRFLAERQARVQESVQRVFRGFLDLAARKVQAKWRSCLARQRILQDQQEQQYDFGDNNEEAAEGNGDADNDDVIQRRPHRHTMKGVTPDRSRGKFSAHLDKQFLFSHKREWVVQLFMDIAQRKKRREPGIPIGALRKSVRKELNMDKYKPILKNIKIKL